MKPRFELTKNNTVYDDENKKTYNLNELIKIANDLNKHAHFFSFKYVYETSKTRLLLNHVQTHEPEVVYKDLLRRLRGKDKACRQDLLECGLIDE